MALKPKFTYFNCIGLGEPIRFLFAYLGRDYDDNRFEDDVWDKLKPTTPWGKVPVLEVEGQKPVVQSIAIARYLAKEAGLTGKDPWEDLRIDEIVYVINDLRADYESLRRRSFEAVWFERILVGEHCDRDRDVEQNSVLEEEEEEEVEVEELVISQLRRKKETIVDHATATWIPEGSG
ncbi:hypothetical protein J6590_106319, partial [Homalodisca vitripennis]